MQNTIIYIHGFRSDGASSKPKKIQKLLPDYKIVGDSFSPNPTIVIEQLQKLYDACTGEVIFMGTSMGGFYSMYAALKFGCKCICINPSLLSHQTLAAKTGSYKTFNLGLDYDFKVEYLEVLQQMHQESFDTLATTDYRPVVIFNEDDDVIHHSLFDDFKAYFNVTYYPNGGHRATNIETIVKDLKW